MDTDTDTGTAAYSSTGTPAPAPAPAPFIPPISAGRYSGEGSVRKCLFTITGHVMDRLELLKKPIGNDTLFELKAIFKDIFTEAVELLDEPEAVVIYKCQNTSRCYIVTVTHNQKVYYILRNVNLCQCQDYQGLGYSGTKVMCPHVLAARLAFLYCHEPVIVDDVRFSELVDNFTYKPKPVFFRR